MSREAKKKPGDHADARRRHVKRQAIQDAITAVKRDGLTAVIEIHKHETLGMCKWELSPAVVPIHYTDPTGKTTTTEDYPCPGVYLVRVNGSRLAIGWVVDKDGIKLCAWGVGTFYISNTAQVLAAARPLNDAAKAWA